MLVSQTFAQSTNAAEIVLNSDSFKQGDTIEVLIKDDSSKKTGSTDGDGSAGGTDATAGAALQEVHFIDRSYKVFPLKAGQADGAVGKALIGVNALQKPGKFTLKYGDQEKTVTIAAGMFGVQVLSLPKGKDNFISSPGEEETVQKAKATLTPHQYWLGQFLKPSQARTSSPYGVRRRVNGKLLPDYFHSGQDFAGAIGSPITACANGKVIISKWGWRLHGNTVAIDHGQGVVSFYIHMSKILVKEGDMVSAGQKIGLIGATGRASGPHLHFSLYVNNNAVNPWNWFHKSF